MTLSTQLAKSKNKKENLSSVSIAIMIVKLRLVIERLSALVTIVLVF